jgi:hypothetical protein
MSTNASHTLTAVARDAAHVTTSAPVTVTVRNPPTIVSVSAGSITSGSATIA